MDLSNLNDQEGVRALLDRLRSSQAWQDTFSRPVDAQVLVEQALAEPSPPTSTTTSSRSTFESYSHASASGSTTSVADLLSQLQTNAPSIFSNEPESDRPIFSWHTESEPQHSHPHPYKHHSYSTHPGLARRAHSQIDLKSTLMPDVEMTTPLASTHELPIQRADVDIKSMSFAQALPLLGELSSNTRFSDAIIRMKADQVALEHTLWRERQSIKEKYDERVKVAQTKAKMTGAQGLTRFEAEKITNAFQKELAKFDAERVLPAWDGLTLQQQSALQELDVPTMFATNERGNRERQQRVVQVLEGIL